MRSLPIVTRVFGLAGLVFTATLSAQPAPPVIAKPPFYEDFGKLKQGEIVPDFDLISADGQAARFSDYAKSRPVVLGLWSGNPAETLLARWNDLAAAYAGQGLVFLGVSGYTSREAFAAWVEQNRATLKFPVAYDPAGKLVPAAKTRQQMTPDEMKTEAERSRAYLATTISTKLGGVVAPTPTTIAFDATGRLVGWSSGFNDTYPAVIGNLLLRAGVALAAVDLPGKIYTTADFAAAKDAAKAAAAERGAMPAIGAMAPDFTTMDMAGHPVKLSDFRGKVVVLDFWATWCGPCIASMPHTNKVAKRFQDQGVVVLGSCTSDTRAAFEKWVRANREKYPDFIFTHDPLEHAPDTASRKLYGVSGIPQQFIIDREGRVAALCRGFLRGEVILEGALAQAGVSVDPAIVAQAKIDLAKRGASVLPPAEILPPTKP